MVALQIRDVPEEIRDLLARRAAAQGQSLQALLLELVTREAGFLRNLEILQEAEHWPGGLTDDPDAAVRALHESRYERDAELGIPAPYRAHADEVDDFSPRVKGDT